jgi:hypothetical protein
MLTFLATSTISSSHSACLKVNCVSSPFWTQGVVAGPKTHATISLILTFSNCRFYLLFGCSIIAAIGQFFFPGVAAGILGIVIGDWGIALTGLLMFLLIPFLVGIIWAWVWAFLVLKDSRSTKNDLESPAVNNQTAPPPAESELR